MSKTFYLVINQLQPDTKKITNKLCNSYKRVCVLNKDVYFKRKEK